MAVDGERLRLYRQMWSDELEAAELYRALATSSEGRRAQVLSRLAESEEGHAAHWERLLRAGGVTQLTRGRTSLRTRLLSLLARRFGTDTVLPMVLRLEAADAAKYRDVDEAPEAMSADEMAHGRTLAALGGDPRGTQIARSEGRHRGGAGGALRAAVFGINDGLVSNLLLVLGVAGGTSSQSFLLLAGLGGLLAGAFSMAAGEWISVTSQRELYEREIAVEAEEIAAFPEEEQQELAYIYEAKGLSEEEAMTLAGHIMRHPESALDTLVREELGLTAGRLGSPWVAAGSSFVAFAVGAFVPVVPFLVASGTAALVGALFASAAALAVVGLLIGVLAGRSPGRGALRMMGIAGIAGTASFLAGNLIGAGVNP